MKKYLSAIFVLLAILGLLYYLFDESDRDRQKKKSAYDSTQSQVDSLKNQRDQSSSQIVALNKSVTQSLGFLQKWREHYAQTRDYEAIINRLAESTHCAVVGRKWNAKKVTLGRSEYDTDEFEGTVVGDYRDIVKFIGELESTIQLSTIWKLEFKEGVNEVTCNVVVYLPTLMFGGGGKML